MHVWSSLVVVGVPHDSPRAQRAHSKTPPKFHEKTSQRMKIRTHFAAREEKNAKFWASHPSGLPPFGLPLFLGLCLWPTPLHEKKEKKKTRTNSFKKKPNN